MLKYGIEVVSKYSTFHSDPGLNQTSPMSATSVMTIILTLHHHFHSSCPLIRAAFSPLTPTTAINSSEQLPLLSLPQQPSTYLSSLLSAHSHSSRRLIGTAYSPQTHSHSSHPLPHPSSLLSAHFHSSCSLSSFS